MSTTRKTMRFSITAGELSQALQGVRSAVGGEHWDAFGDRLLITSNQGPGIVFAGINGTYSTVRWMDLETQGASLGQALDARAFTDIVKTFPAEEQVTILTEEETEAAEGDNDPAVKRYRTHLSCGDAITATFLGLAEEAFPDLEERPESGLRLKAGNLYRALKKVVFAAGNREVAHQVLQGIHAEFAEHSLTLASADGFRLARQVMPLELETVTEPFSVTIPRQAVQELLRLLKVMPGEAPVLFTANRRDTSAQFLCGNALLTTVLFYSAEFPDYHRIIPDMNTYPTRVTADRRSLLQACERARIFSTNLIYFHSAPDTLTVTATANSGLLNEGQTVLSAKVTDTEVTKIAFNPRYIIEMLKVLEADQVVLAFSGAGRPGVFYAADETDAWRDYIYVVMPMVQNISEVERNA